MIKSFEKFFENYKSLYDPKAYKKEPKIEELILKTRNNKDYLIKISDRGNFTKDEMTMIWEDFQPIYDSYNLSLPETREDFFNYNPNIIHFEVAANAHMDIFIEGDLEDIKEIENDIRTFISGLDKLGIKARIAREGIEFEDQGWEISITFFKKKD
jgi:hypothetical protein